MKGEYTMKNRKSLYITALLLFCFCLTPLTAQAAEYDIHYGRSTLAGMPNAAVLLYAYDAIAEGVEESAAEISIYDGTHALSQDDLAVVMEAYTGDHAEHFWMGSQYYYGYNSKTVLSIQPTYLLSGNALLSARADFEEAIEEILSGLRADWSDFEKELYLHDALAEKITYTFGTNAHNAYGALVEGQAVCEGYAEAFQVLLHRAGIRSYIVTGWSRGEGHAWNLVEIDGEYYYVDLTWNDQGEELYHAYFNITEEILCEDHVIGGTIGLPECSAEDANYFTVMGGAVSAFNAAEIGGLLMENGLTVHLYAAHDLTGEELTSAYAANIRQVAAAAGIRGGFMYGYSSLGREVVLRIIPTGLSGEIRKIREDSLTITVRGLFDATVTADLYAAVYDEDGRMIGMEKVEGQTLTTGGSSYTVGFDGDADTVKAFAVDTAGVPFSAAVELNIR